ncbi:MAG: hypothetical protein ABSB58_12690 [Gemmatimonadales bacterium]|jgi:hypothetical protein
MLAAFLTPGFQSFETPPLATVRALVTSGRAGLAAYPGPTYRAGADGRFYTDHELGTALVAYPVGLAAEGLSRATGADFKRLFELGCGLAGCVLAALAVLLLLSLARELELEERRLLPPLLVLLLSSQYVVYATSLADVAVSAPLAAGCALCWARADRGRRAAWLLAGLYAGALMVVKLSNATFLVLLVLLALAHGLRGYGHRLVAASLVVAGALPALALALWWNAVRTGSPLHAPYLAELHGFHAAGVPEALVGSLVSPDKGVLAYTPALLGLPLALRPLWTGGRRGRYLALVGGSLALALLRISGMPEWTSAGGWGIRYYVPWVPLLLLPLAAMLGERPSARRRWVSRVVWTATALGLVVNLAGVLTNQMYRQQACGYAAWSFDGMNACAVRALPGNLARAVGAKVPEIVVPDASAADTFASNRLAVWWYAARRAGVPPALSWGLGLFLLGSGALLLRAGIHRMGPFEGDGSPEPVGGPGPSRAVPS